MPRKTAAAPGTANARAPLSHPDVPNRTPTATLAPLPRREQVRSTYEWEKKLSSTSAGVPPGPRTISLDQSNLLHAGALRAWCMVLPTMAVGEQCEVIATAPFCYGDEGDARLGIAPGTPACDRTGEGRARAGGSWMGAGALPCWAVCGAVCWAPCWGVC